MATVLILRINNTLIDQAFPAGTYKDVNFAIDYLILSAGSEAVADGLEIPSTDELNQAALQLDGINPKTVPKYLLAASGEDMLYEVKLAGNQDKRYVFCASFDGATASEPVLEAWDDININTTLTACLGAGIPNSSWYKAICTTDGLPGPNWGGISLAGSGVLNRVLLNNEGGALTGAKDLYFNLKVIVPAIFNLPGLFTPVLLISYTTN